jgi:diguanylate cyclase (GGDEF)-like protein
MRRHAENLAAVAEVARTLPTVEARSAVCAAAVRLSDASFVHLFEPEGNGFRATAQSGIEQDTLWIDRVGPSGTAVAFDSGESLFVADAFHSDVLSQEFARRTGSRSVLFEPVHTADRVTGVLVVAWSEPVAELPADISDVIALLAAEAGVAIERTDLLARVQHMADHDSLTGLLNRRRFQEELVRELARAQRHGRAGALLAIDLDGFKSVNDALGHAAGDELLRRVGMVLRDRLRASDVVARLGGDEFAVILPETPLSEAHVLAETVGEALRLADEHGVTASIGVAGFDGIETPTPHTLLASADAAMYAAKDDGPGRVVSTAVGSQ